MKHFLLLLFLIISTNVFSSLSKTYWGKTGHRTVGEIANKYVTKTTVKKIDGLLNGESLAFVSIYADEIRSDRKYDEFVPWHYVNFEGDKKYKEDPINPKGDIIQGIKNCILKIRNDKTSKEDKAFYLRLLVHFVGDLHMPLHVGNKKDKGGNIIKVKWFGKEVNLHWLWDDSMIDSYEMSYTELANNAKKISKKEIADLQKGSLLNWVYESRTLALQVYKSAQNGDNLGYQYMYHHFPIVREQLQKGGIRLAKILDETFKKKSSWLDAFLSEI